MDLQPSIDLSSGPSQSRYPSHPILKQCIQDILRWTRMSQENPTLTEQEVSQNNRILHQMTHIIRNINLPSSISSSASPGSSLIPDHRERQPVKLELGHGQHRQGSQTWEPEVSCAVDDYGSEEEPTAKPRCLGDEIPIPSDSTHIENTILEWSKAIDAACGRKMHKWRKDEIDKAFEKLLKISGGLSGIWQEDWQRDGEEMILAMAREGVHGGRRQSVEEILAFMMDRGREIDWEAMETDWGNDEEVVRFIESLCRRSENDDEDMVEESHVDEAAENTTLPLETESRPLPITPMSRWRSQTAEEAHEGLEEESPSEDGFRGINWDDPFWDGHTSWITDAREKRRIDHLTSSAAHGAVLANKVERSVYEVLIRSRRREERPLERAPVSCIPISNTVQEPREIPESPSSGQRDGPGSRHTSYQVLPPFGPDSSPLDQLVTPYRYDRTDIQPDMTPQIVSGTPITPTTIDPKLLLQPYTPWHPGGGGGEYQPLSQRYQLRPPPPPPIFQTPTSQPSISSFTLLRETPPPAYHLPFESVQSRRGPSEGELGWKSSFVLDSHGVIQYMKPQSEGGDPNEMNGQSSGGDGSSDDEPIRMRGRRKHGIV